jgi:hypothetical protein
MPPRKSLGAEMDFAAENRAKECGPIDFVTPYYGEIRKSGQTSPIA